MKIIIIVIALFSGLFFLKNRKDNLAREAAVARNIKTEIQAHQNQPKPTETPYVQCPIKKRCHSLRVFEEGCRLERTHTKCQNFIKFFKKLAITTHCMRPSDKEPVPLIWICDEESVEISFPKLHERSAQTLSELDTREALQFYGSDTFRSTLYGYLKEKHLDASYNAEAKATDDKRSKKQ